MRNGAGDEEMTVFGETARAVGRFFDERAGQYEEKMSSPYWRLMREITWQHIRKYLPREKGATVLDAGGATGHWSARLAKAGYRVVLLDVSKRMLAVAKEKIEAEGLGAAVDIVQGDIADLREFAEGSFDAALALEEPLSFCGDPEMAVTELALVTKSGGMVAASVLNRYKNREFEKFLRKGDVDGLSTYLESGVTEGSGGVSRKSFGAEEVEALFGANGLEVVSAIAKPVFADAVGGRLAEAGVFSRILQMEMTHNAKRSLWGNADILEFIAAKA